MGRLRPRLSALSRVLRRTERVPYVMALLTGAVGVLTMISALVPGQRASVNRLIAVLGEPVAALATSTAVAAGLILLVLSSGLRRGKRRAWAASVIALAVITLLHVLPGVDLREAGTSAGVLGLLVLARAQFRAVSERDTLRRAVGALLGLFGGGIACGMLMLAANPDDLAGSYTTRDRIASVLHAMVGTSGPVHFRSPALATVFVAVLSTLGALSAAIPLVLALRSVRPSDPLTSEQEQLVRDLLARHGQHDSLGYFATRRDKSVVMSPSGKAAVSYRVVAGVLLASGDPIGDVEAWPAAIEKLLDLAATNAWLPAVIGCSEKGGRAYARSGLLVLELGDEAVVPTGAFSLDGRAMRGVRQAVGRIERAGFIITARRAGELRPDEWSELSQAADRWRNGPVERGFSMALGRLGDSSDAQSVVVAARNADGGLSGFLHFVPWGPDGLSLDVMRRDQAVENGLNEAMIVAVLQRAEAMGVRRVSLNFAMFRAALDAGGRLGAGPLLRGWRGVLIVASRWWQIDSLFRFNAKFRPVWEPRYVCYPAARHLPRVALAAARAEAFLTLPGWADSVRQTTTRVPPVGSTRAVGEPL